MNFIKILPFFLMGSILFSCQPAHKELPHIPKVYVEAGSTSLLHQQGALYYKGKPYSGYIVKHYQNGVMSEKIAYTNGWKSNYSYAWHRNKARSYERLYIKGKKEGIAKGWFSNGNKKFLYHYKNGKHEGKNIEWFISGDTASIKNYTTGHEVGLQRTWGKNGKLANNYFMKNGKRYGLIGRFDCVTTKNQNNVLLAKD